MKTKFMTLMTVATLGIFSAATVMAAGNNDFYTQPPAGSEWEKADTEGTYASYTNGNDYVNIYKLILSRLVDTFFSRISLTMPPAPKSHNTAYVLPWEEPLHWQSRSSGYSSS